MKTSQILDLAADTIERRGWIGHNNPSKQSPWGGGAAGDAPLCLEGGIAAAMGLRLVHPGSDEWEESMSTMERCPAYHAVENYLDNDNYRDGNLYVWNDSSARTAAEVIEVLRATAAVERVKEESLSPVMA